MNMEDSGQQPLITKYTLHDVHKKDAEKVYSRVSWRLLPPLFLMTVFCYVDRTNISLAVVDMSKELGISKTEYGTAASIFFATYTLGQVFSNMVLERVGGPIWLGSIVAAWGIVASLTAFVKKVWQLYMMRLLLGIFESGTFPGAWLYLSHFFPDERFSFVTSVVTAGVAVGLGISAPLAGGILSLDGTWRYSGWRWLFFIEGLPSILLGCFMMFYLPKSPTSKNFLSAEEQTILEADKILTSKVRTDLVALKDVVTNWKLWINVLAFVMTSTSRYASQFWTPLWIHSMASGHGLNLNEETLDGDDGGESGIYVAFLTAIPSSLAALATVILGWSSKFCHETKYHVILPTALGGLVFCLLPELSKLGSMAINISALSLIQCTAAGICGLQVALSVKCMTHKTISFGCAWFNGLGNLSGLIGPYMVGALVDRTGSYVVSLYLAGGIMCLAAITYLLVPGRKVK